MMVQQRVRPIAICIIEDEGRILVFEAQDSATGATFYRPLGGGIEFGETGAECVSRELREEIGARLQDVAYLGMIENIFTYDGQTGHEIVLVYEANLADSARYRSGPVAVHEESETLPGRWVALDDFRSGVARLVPEELLNLLDDGRVRSPRSSE
jgi:8-oxo-dGTP pyrophosphatase MutT (NUDIX family)